MGEKGGMMVVMTSSGLSCMIIWPLQLSGAARSTSMLSPTSILCLFTHYGFFIYGSLDLLYITQILILLSHCML